MKQFRLKKIALFFFPVFIFLLHLPFGFAKITGFHPISGTSFTTHTETEISKISNKAALTVYDSLKLGVLGLSQQAFNYAITGLDYLAAKQRIANTKIISIIDFSQPSGKKRLFVIDMARKKILFNTYVAHGINSGKEYASQFSNMPESNKSSLGFYETTGTYMGKNGYSLHLTGLEKGINDNACNRDIVMHGAGYVSEALVQMQGYIGRSQGCPAVSEKLHKPIIDKIKNGTCLFMYSPDKNYIRHSGILKAAAAQPTVL
jgi:hypothetical protein